MTMIPILLQYSNSISSACVFGGTPTPGGSLNTGGWIQINLLVILLSFSVSAMLYSLSGFFPTSMREKMKGAAKYESFQGIISIFIIIVLMAFSSVTCQIGQTLVASSTQITQTSYQNPIQYSEHYIGNLMFTKGLGLFTQIYSESVLMAISANTADVVEEALSELVIGPMGLSFSPGMVQVLYGFSGAMGSSFLPLIVVAFGVLFIIYLILPIIASLALTVIVPLSIVMRSIPYAGPKLRESSDTFLALAVGFYFILPLTLLMNSYIIAWIYCTPSSAFCNPYVQYTAQYQLSNIPTSALFDQNSQVTAPLGQLGVLKLSSSFFSSSVANQGGFFSVIGDILQIMFAMPSVIMQYGLKTAEYVFEAVFLIGLDLAITLAFAQGLTKGLNSTGRMIGVGPFWGG